MFVGSNPSHVSSREYITATLYLSWGLRKNIVVCGLSEDELYILNILYSKRCLSPDHEMNSKLLEKKFNKRGIGDFDKSIKKLLNLGYITIVPKKDPKYYISGRKEAIFALNSHGYNTTRGKERPL